MKFVQDANEAMYEIAVRLKKAPEYSPRGHKVKEVLNYSICMMNPIKSIMTLNARKLKLDYVKHELKWYLMATRDINYIAQHAKMWTHVADEGKYANSNYGVYIWKQKTPEKISQWKYCVNKLIEDKDSRQAMININQVSHKYNTKDFPCTINIQFFIRDDKLHMIANMRSNDAIFGFGNDLPFFTFLQRKMLLELQRTYKKLQLGYYYHNAASMHVYEKHYEMIDEIIKEYEHENTPDSGELDMNILVDK